MVALRMPRVALQARLRGFDCDAQRFPSTSTTPAQPLESGQGPHEFLPFLAGDFFSFLPLVRRENDERKTGKAPALILMHDTYSPCHKGEEGKLGTKAALAAKVMF